MTGRIRPAVFQTRVRGGLHQFVAPQQVVGSLFQLLIGGFLGSLPCYEYGVPSRGDGAGTECFPQPALHLVPDHGVTDSLAYHEAETGLVGSIRENPNHQQAICRASTVLVDLRIPLGAG